MLYTWNKQNIVSQLYLKKKVDKHEWANLKSI